VLEDLDLYLGGLFLGGNQVFEKWMGMNKSCGEYALWTALISFWKIGEMKKL